MISDSSVADETGVENQEEGLEDFAMSKAVYHFGPLNRTLRGFIGVIDMLEELLVLIS